MADQSSDYLWGYRPGCDFLPEIRIGLERLGRATEFFTTSEVSQEEKMVQAYVKAVAYMSPRKIGALVAIQGARTLQEYISTGIPLDADISGELLINIFIPNTPLHDGAVIVRNDKIAVSCAYLPLTENTGISKSSERVTAQPLVYLKFPMLLPLWYQKKRAGSL